MAIRNTQPDDETVTEQTLDQRDARALTECMAVLPTGGSMFDVVGENGSTYAVDAKRGRCECADQEHNLPDGDREECKHLARVRFATGEQAIPGWVDMDRVDDLLGEQLPNSEPRVAMADGGMFRDAVRGRYETEDVDGGVLVYDRDCDGIGRELVGFSEVEDWDALRSAVAKKGHNPGAIHHHEVFEPEEVGLWPPFGRSTRSTTTAASLT
jgi:hypothetical protein